MWRVIFCYSCIYVIYLLFGGCIFLLSEDIIKIEVKEQPFYYNSTVNFTYVEDRLRESGFTNLSIEEAIKRWEPNKKFSFFYKSEADVHPKWNLFNGFMFAFYITTTVGYGNIVPHTVPGQLLCLVYGIIGIPVSSLVFKLLGQSFSEAYKETKWLIQGNVTSSKNRHLVILGFFIPWSIVLIILPSLVFTFTEDWNYLDGLYYTVITLTTIGLGDYVAGEKLQNKSCYIPYKLTLVCWMIHGLAFYSMIADSLSRVMSKFCLYTVDISWNPCKIKFYRVLLDIEKLDIHFRLLNADQCVDPEFSIFRIKKTVETYKTFKHDHLKEVAFFAESLKSALAAEYSKRKHNTDSDTSPLKIEHFNQSSKISL